MTSVVRSACLLALFALVAPLAAGCGEQGEGERCDQNNGDADCESGLVCTPRGDLIGAGDVGDLCCPPPGQLATDTACFRSTIDLDPDDGGQGGSGGTTDAGVPPVDGGGQAGASATDAAGLADVAAE